jgi:formate-dependent nitrite reductase membrane component NrfD
MLIAALMWLFGWTSPLITIAAPLISIAAITATAIVLIADLERPERFYYILTRSNFRSWMVWGAYFLTAHGALSAFWLLCGWFGYDTAFPWLAAPMFLVALMATSYTGFLFAQGLGRDLWQGPMAAIDLFFQSIVAGAATLLLTAAIFDADDMIGNAPLSDYVTSASPFLAFFLGVGLGGHLLILVFEHLLTPSPTRHHELATQTFLRGAYSTLFWAVAVVAGGIVPLALLLAFGASSVAIIAIAAVLALAGGAAWEYIWVEAGQSVPLS